MQRIGAVVSCGWLARILSPHAQSLRVLDATWHMPDSNIDARMQFTKQHIPGAQFFDITACSLPHTQLSNTLPKPEQFSEYVGNLGICNNTHVVIYDNHDQYGMFSAPRAWWMFRVFGHNTVSVLDGGFRRWLEEGHPVASSSGPTEIEQKRFEAVLQPHLLAGFSDMIANLESEKFQVMDARGQPRFTGQAPEPREGLPRGHIPGAKNVPFASVFHTEGSDSEGLMKSSHELQQIFALKCIDLEQPLTATCGSGITACILALAAHQAGKKDVAVYDGSWEEYAQRATSEQMVTPSIPEHSNAG